MLYALLLAGGKSSRMGEDKSALTYNGKSLLEHSLGLLKLSGADHILISGEVAGHQTIPDLLPECGPLGGLHAAVHTIDDKAGLDGSSLLVIPVDMPMLDSLTLTRLFISIGDADSCFYEGEVFPCVFKLNKQLRDHLDGLFSESNELGGDRSMKALLRAFSSRPIDTNGLPENVFFNLNSPEDWSQFKDMQ
jgi:molybdenum cofactor guanylyltransferase